MTPVDSFHCWDSPEAPPAESDGGVKVQVVVRWPCARALIGRARVWTSGWSCRFSERGRVWSTWSSRCPSASGAGRPAHQFPVGRTDQSEGSYSSREGVGVKETRKERNKEVRENVLTSSLNCLACSSQPGSDSMKSETCNRGRRSNPSKT